MPFNRLMFTTLFFTDANLKKEITRNFFFEISIVLLFLKVAHCTVLFGCAIFLRELTIVPFIVFNS